MKALITFPQGYTYSTFFTPENIKLAESLGTMIWNEKDSHFTKDEIKEKIKDCDVYVTTWGSPKLDAEILAAAPNIKLLTHLCGTVAPFVSEEMWDRGIRVISGNPYFAESVAEGTIGYILAALRDIPKFSNNLKEKKQWKKSTDWYEGLLGKKVGLVSYGAIARNLVRMLAPFRTTIYVYDIVEIPVEDKEKYNIKQVSIEEVFSECDIVSIHTPLYNETHHMINKRLLSMLKQGALFVNTSRGKIVDQNALVEELATGRFKAVLDVYEKEPPVENDPIYNLPNVIMMPHMAGPTIDLRVGITHDLLLESAAFIDRGEKLKNEITREAARHMSEK